MERQRLEQLMLQQDLEENRKLQMAKQQLKQEKRAEMRALYQERGSSSEEEDDEEGDDEAFLDRVRSTVSGMFNREKKNDVETMKKQANQEFLHSNLLSYKQNKNSLLY
jgi:triphosphoribosyl-dephospho-CoA synthetase